MQEMRHTRFQLDSTPRPVPAGQRKPTVFVAALTGSKIDGKLSYPRNRPKPSPFCANNADWYLLYAGTDTNDPAAIKTLLPTNYACTLENMKMNITDDLDVKPQDGVQTRIPGENVTSTGNREALLAYDYIAYRQSLVGYTWGVDMFPHPYDFRYGPEQWKTKEYPILKAQVERIYNSTGKKVVLQSISMGGPYVNAFLTTVDQEWKDKYVDFWISIAGSLNGSVEEIGSIINGENYGVPYVDRSKFADMYKTWPSAIWNTPSAGKQSGIIAYTPSRNYTVGELADFMRRAGNNKLATLKENFYGQNMRWDSATDPGVQVYCWFCPTLPTPTALGFTDDSLSLDSRADVMGAGDTVVHLDGLATCTRWKDSEPWLYENMPHASGSATKWTIDRLIQLVADVAECTGFGNAYMSECGEDCAPGDLPIPETDPDGNPVTYPCGMFNLYSQQRCLQVFSWRCDYACGTAKDECVQPWQGEVVRSSDACAAGRMLQYPECKAYAAERGLPFYTYYGAGLPSGCLLSQNAGLPSVGFNYSPTTAAKCYSDTVLGCFCKGDE